MDEKLKRKYEEILARYTGAYILDRNLGADLSDMVRVAREFDQRHVEDAARITELAAGEAYWKNRWATEVDDLRKLLATLRCDKCGDIICHSCTALGDFMHLCGGCDSEV